MTISTIGIGGSHTYSTIQAWESACPANITAGGTNEIWEGDCFFNGSGDGEFLVSAGTTPLVTLSGTTVDSTHYKFLTTGAGQSFADNANKLTNALAYNAANGVALRSSAEYATVISIGEAFVRVSKLMVSSAQTTHTPILGGNATTVSQCIIEGKSGIGDATWNSSGASGDTKYINCLIVHRAAGAGFAFKSSYPRASDGLYNCTVVIPSDIGAGTVIGFNSDRSGQNTGKNTAIFGFSQAWSHTNTTANGGNNCTDDTLNVPGSSNQTGKTYSAQFQNTVDTTRDFRAKSSGSDLALNGTRDQTNTNDIDIIGQTRSTSTPTIGAWEVVVAAVVVTIPASIRQVYVMP